MNKSPHPSLFKRDLLRLLAMLLPAFLLLLGIRPLSSPDEGRYPEVAREMLLTGDYITPKVNGIVFLDKPALYYWLESVSFHLFGVHEWSVRLMPALFGVLGVTLVFITAWKLFSRRAAWWSAAVLATNPLYFLASQYADMNIEIAVLVTAALCLFLLGRNETVRTVNRRNLFWLAWLAIGLGILTKGLIGLAFPAMVVGVWVVLGWRWRELRHWYFVSGAVIALAVCLPWFLAVQQQNPQFFHYFFIYQQFERFSGGGFNNPLPIWFYLPVIIGGLLPWSAWLPLGLRDQWRYAFAKNKANNADVRQLLLLWPLLILVFFSMPSSKIVGYILPVIPPLALLLGDYLARRFENSTDVSLPLRITQWLPAVGATIIVAAIFGAAKFDHSGIRPLVRDLQKQLQPGDMIISYRTYYQDLPMYLQTPKPLIVVDNWDDPEILNEDTWRREFYLGLNHQPEAREWLIDDSRFAELLAQQLSEKNSHLFVLARSREEQTLTARYDLRVIARDKKNILLRRN
jgi:4-amino-4-deoxy-L-arabinose transferase-like glycosyltransferase